MGNPATSSPTIFRIPGTTALNGFLGGLLIQLDEANSKIKLVDEGSKYAVMELPDVVEIGNTLWLDKDNGIGIKLNGSTIEIYFNNLMIYEITQTRFSAYLDVSEQIRVEVDTGDVYIRGQLHADGRDFP